MGKIENETTRHILQYLELRGIYAWRNNTRKGRMGGRFMTFGELGSSDILGIVPPSGRLLAIEVKAPGGSVAPDQIAFLKRISEAGGQVILAHSVEDVISELGGRRPTT